MDQGCSAICLSTGVYLRCMHQYVTHGDMHANGYVIFNNNIVNFYHLIFFEKMKGW